MTTQTDIEITPTELRFKFQLAKSIPSQLVLHNPTNERHAFKIKTTSPKKYCVRPASGFVEAKGTKQIEVIMQAQKEYPSDESTSKDKFLILTAQVGSSDVELAQELFEKGLNPSVREARVRVVLELPQPPETIAEHPDEEPRVEVGPGESEVSVVKLEKEKTELLQQINKLERQLKIPQQLTNGFTLVHLLMVAVLAFLIGHYLKI